MFPPSSRRYGLARFGGCIAPSITPSPPVDSAVIIGGEVTRASGLGEGARVMHQALKKHHIDAHLLDVSPYSFSMARYKKSAQLLSKYLHAPLILHINSPQIPYALLSLPRKYIKNRKIIGYWAWELEVLPKDWIVGFQFVHEIWVPSKFVAKSMEKWAKQFNKIIRVVPHPIADRITYPVENISRQALGLPENKIIILVSFNLSSSFARKNPIGAISAFLKVYEHVKNIALVLKITYAEYYHDDMAKIMNMIQDRDNIVVIKHVLSAVENQALFKYSDIILSLHRSEGFGLVPAEAMLCGKAVISTNWSATEEFIDESCGVPVDYRLIPVQDSRSVYQFSNAYWAEPDCGIAAQAIQNLVLNPHYRFELGKVACKRAKEQFNSQSLIKGLSAIGAVINKG
ncbi:glycosyltransferase family 4 protein [Commensalibacter papalotli (ex Botero et al. 2024)]|uniref:Glycosyltransferase involved in cell wall bisynthesis (RfaB) (PDB:2IV7) n=1 Tax=Commensalibacter papalotli (ex Botero et al. 2024) TaxID=2972766 RepID=A0ABM9HIE7_9PROT|nr:glycosyltransferase family 4 protein [Commensalibacter papalotli (ex Botero et al. 2024)]CAI3922924.1 Glycosyltransferase involved in cell wall bisynthesis (RfaB) (PDB:2IV7) [Commensalibacter papalotli (ex Botero et al. 2024)]CAI3929250.1 Glycosyltransferase involved in cell wall bisynthesis (RfaB) (PDB:2IV7) [Commensalibacter papalotli (ex Botero et al. 2024)]